MAECYTREYRLLLGTMDYATQDYEKFKILCLICLSFRIPRSVVFVFVALPLNVSSHTSHN